VTTRAEPVRLSERAPAPDLARGAALLGIAVANSVVHLYGREVGPSSRPLDGSGVDRVVDALAALFVDNRGYPLFAFLLGYGTAQLVGRQRTAGVPVERTTGVLGLRALALLAFGALHAALLFSGDILGLYGLVALVLVVVPTARDGSLAVAAAVCLVPLAALGALDGAASGSAQGTSHATADYLASVGARLAEWGLGLLTAPFLGIGVLAPALLGVLAGRRRLLDEPGAHRRLLRRVALVGIAVGVVGGVPLALTSTGAWRLGPAADAAVGAVHGLTGLAGALGYAALAGLVALGTGPVRRALVACGRRSLSAYLAQSLLLVPLLAPWGLGLGGRLGTAAAAGLAAGVWVLTVVWTAVLERRGRRGPAEVLLRRMVYRGQPTERQGSERSRVT
jgi:uncharacterized membrane protein YeiB